MLMYSVALLISIIAFSEAKMQNVTVFGTAICHKHRMANVKVELWEKDKLSKNDLLAAIHTNKDGDFFLTGGNSEITMISPFVKFHHDCGVENKPGQRCWRETKYDIPSEFIYNKETPKENIKGYDMEFISLDIFVKNEKEICE